MTTIAYCYSEPLLGPPPDMARWPQPIDQIYQDLSPERPELRQLLSDLQQAPPDQRPESLLVHCLDALAETLAELTERLAQLGALGIAVVEVESDASQPDADAGQRLAAAQQRLLQRRLQRGHARKRLKSLPPPGKAPYGYRRSPSRYELDKPAATVVQAFFEQFILYGSLRGAVRHIGQRYGKQISPSTGKRWLTSPVYRGHTAYKDGGIIPQTHEPILTAEEAAQVDRLLRRSQFLPPRTASAPRSLSGLVTCQTCGSAMKITRVSSPRQTQTYLYLQPTSCSRQPHCRSLQYETVLQKTIETICAELPKAVAHPPATATARKTALTQTLRDQQQVLTQLPALVDSGVLDVLTADLRTYQLKTEIAATEQALAQLPPVNLPELFKTVALPQFWQDLSEPERRFFFREFIRAVHIHPDRPDWLTLEFIF
ncbi:MAG: recombinase family protein [Cyanobacteria bacterium J06648_16]